MLSKLRILSRPFFQKPQQESYIVEVLTQFINLSQENIEALPKVKKVTTRLFKIYNKKSLTWNKFSLS